jgi:hypothetical protein
VSDQNLKNLTIANVALPGAMAAAVIATALFDDLNMFVGMGSAVALFGLSIVNLVAPVLLWKRHGIRSLIPAATLVLAGLVGVWVAGAGERVILSRTPLSATFLRGKTQQELESVGYKLLARGDPGRTSATLENFEFTTDVDTAGRVVTFSHYRIRTWTNYYFAPYGLPGPLTTDARITAQDIPDWGALRRIARYAASGRTRGAHQFGFEASIGMPIVREALGDSLLSLSDAPPKPITASMKLRLIAALNERCSADSRLIEHPSIVFDGSPPTLCVELMRVPDGWRLSQLLKQLMADGVVKIDSDGRHFVLAGHLTGNQRNRVEWLHAGILEFAFSDLLKPHEYNYDRRVGDHWYVWRM